jgi:anti-sigma-K factor RskA
MTDNRDTDEPGALAAEYAAGVLEGDDLADARRREVDDPAFAKEVARWRGRLAPLLDDVDDVAPPAALWRRVEARLGGRSDAANDNDAALRRSVGIWRTATAGMTALAACLALALLWRAPVETVVTPQPRAVESTPMVAMVGDKQATKVMVSWDPASRQMIMAVAGALPGDAGHSHELWVIPSDGKPRSLGTLGTDRQSHKRLAETLAKLLEQGATIAISVEPRGGSPTGAPTGPVIASGALTAA